MSDFVFNWKLKIIPKSGYTLFVTLQKSPELGDYFLIVKALKCLVLLDILGDYYKETRKKFHFFMVL